MQCQIFAFFRKNAIACMIHKRPSHERGRNGVVLGAENGQRGRELSQESRTPSQQGIKINRR